MTFHLPQKEMKKEKQYDCEVCGLYRTATNAKIQPYVGEDYNGLLIIGNKINKEEDLSGKNIMGTSGRLLRVAALKSKINLNNIGAITNATLCRFTKKSEVYFKCCRNYLQKNIMKLKPKLIICLGEEAANSVLGLKSKEGITKLRNRVIPNYEFNCLVYCTANPSDLYWKKRNEDDDEKLDKTKEQAFNWDLERIFKLWNYAYHSRRKVDQALKERSILEGINIKQITTVKALEAVARKIRDNECFSFDYETTNTKPYDSNHEVWVVGFGIGKNAYVIYVPEFENISKLKQITFNLLQDKSLTKYIQNDKFEEMVSRFWLNKPNQRVINNSFCPMLATHVIDERRGCTSLDFQNLVRFGFLPYNDKVKKYLEAKNKDDKKNTIDECNKHDLVYYNGLDVISTYFQGQLIDTTLLDRIEKRRECYEFLHEGHDAFVDATERGFPVDSVRLDNMEKFLIEEQDKILETIMDMPEIQVFLDAIPDKKKPVIKPKITIRKIRRKIEL